MEADSQDQQSDGGGTEKSTQDASGDSTAEHEANPKVSKAQPGTGSGESSAPSMDPANLHYEGEVCIYTDPDTKYQYQWDSGTEQWTPRAQQPHLVQTPSDPKRPGDQNYEFDGETYTYTDASSGLKYRFDKGKNEWITMTQKTITERPKGRKKKPLDEEDIEENDTDDEEEKEEKVVRQDMSSGHYDFDGENHTYTDPKDGAVYFWDRLKNAWFPKVDDDFMARYQMSYGFLDNKNEEESDKSKEEGKPKSLAADGKRKAPEPPQWFELDERNNTKVYVSNLPLDITEQEFVDLMQKCGLVMKDADTNKMKVKLYHEPGNTKVLKGDALCTYIKRESVDLALKILDGYDVNGKKIKVEPAKFELKGEYDPTKKPKKKRRKDKDKLKKAQEKLFDWRPDKLRGERSKHEKTVIIKNLFDPKIFDTEVGLILEFQQDLREEAAKCGDVRKVIVYDRHAEGVAQINFKDPEEADACVQLFNNRWFNQRRITAETWDGKTKYRVAETAEETEARLAKWSKFLESEEGKKSGLGANNYDNDKDSDEEADTKEPTKEHSTRSGTNIVFAGKIKDKTAVSESNDDM